jgi:excisionase family DNA binding protein
MKTQQVEKPSPHPISRVAYTISEAAIALGVSRRVVEGCINRGELKARLVGKQLLIAAKSLEGLVR